MGEMTRDRRRVAPSRPESPAESRVRLCAQIDGVIASIEAAVGGSGRFRAADRPTGGRL